MSDYDNYMYDKYIGDKRRAHFDSLSKGWPVHKEKDYRKHGQSKLILRALSDLLKARAMLYDTKETLKELYKSYYDGDGAEADEEVKEILNSVERTVGNFDTGVMDDCCNG